MAGPAPPPGKGRLVLIWFGLSLVIILAWLLLRPRPEPEPVVISEPARPEQPIAYYLARGDVARGERFFARCAACHTINEGGPNGVGPNLWGAMGARIATRPGFEGNSDSLKDMDGRWDWETTARFLQNPRRFAPGTRMAFAGITEPQDRADVMLYMNRQGGNLPWPEGATAGVTRDFLIGSWSTGSCDPPAAVYAADGTTDGGRRRWELNGDRLIVSRGAEREQSVIERLGDNRMRLDTADGPFELTRCPAVP